MIFQASSMEVLNARQSQLDKAVNFKKFVEIALPHTVAIGNRSKLGIPIKQVRIC